MKNLNNTKNETINYIISFNKKYVFGEKQTELIKNMINKLYDTNENFKLLVNNYNNICITKPIHNDSYSIYNHFTGYLYNTNNKTQSSKLHYYISNKAIINITKVESII